MNLRIASRVWINGRLDHLQVEDPKTGQRITVHVFGGNVVAFPGSLRPDYAPPPCDTEGVLA